MGVQERRQREFQQREDQILLSARKILANQGYLGLNMDKIADEIEYAKGTVYQHFSCKEEIIIALANETLLKRSEMFRRAASFKSLSRERLVSISVAAEVFVRLHPDHFRVEQLIRMSSIWDKTSQERRNTMRTCEMNCMSILSGIVRDGIAQGDFKLPEPMTPEDIVFGLWSLNSGGHMIIDSSASLQEIGVSDPFLALKRHNNALLDGYQWKPLSHEHDFTQVFQETLDHVFPEEKRELETLLQ